MNRIKSFCDNDRAMIDFDNVICVECGWIDTNCRICGCHSVFFLDGILDCVKCGDIQKDFRIDARS